MRAWYTMELVEDNLKKLSQAKVLVIGDVMLDQYWMGDVKRISPEAPVPVVAVNETVERVGGAGNVARNITALDGSCTLLSIVGDDEAGRSVKSIAENSGVSCVIEIDSSIKTTIKLRVIARNQQLLRADFENSPSDVSVFEMRKKFDQLVMQHDVVVLSDYGKGCLLQVEKLIEIAQENNKPVLVDPKGSDFSRYRGANLITPNLSEFEAVAGEVKGQSDLHEKAQKTLISYALDQLLVTQSDKGMTLFQSETEPVHIAARSREVYDVSGAGDTVIAMMAMAMSIGLSAQASMELANSAAGIVISKLGTATTTIEELALAMNKDYQS